ncbi:MAG: twin-arginine translocation signal domain-containing protein [Actinomycetota bacterium]
MTDYNRRDFLKLAGAGTAAAAVVGSGTFATLRLIESKTKSGTMTFRAVTGLPQQPLPAYASYVLDGTVDLASGTGAVRRMLFAGAPESMSSIAFQELTRDLRVTSIRGSGNRLTLNTVIDGALHPGESRTGTIVVDRSSGEVQAPFVGNDVMMQLQP